MSEKTIKMKAIINEYFYLIREREFIKSNQDIYKLGKSKQEFGKRFGGYSKGTEILITLRCQNVDEFEKKMIKIFSDKFSQKKEIGTEYFEGSLTEMLICVLENHSDFVNVIEYFRRQKSEEEPTDSGVEIQEIKEVKSIELSSNIPKNIIGNNPLEPNHYILRVGNINGNWMNSVVRNENPVWGISSNRNGKNINNIRSGDIIWTFPEKIGKPVSCIIFNKFEDIGKTKEEIEEKNMSFGWYNPTISGNKLFDKKILYKVWYFIDYNNIKEPEFILGQGGFCLIKSEKLNYFKELYEKLLNMDTKIISKILLKDI